MKIKPFGKMVFKSSGSLGDYVVMNGLINHFASLCDRLYLPVRVSLYDNICQMFENNRSIIVASHTDFSAVDKMIVDEAWGVINEPDIMFVNQVPVFWDEQIYTFYDIPFSYRYINFTLPNNLDKSKELYDRVVKNERYVLIHQKFGSTIDKVDLKLPRLEESVQVIELNEQLSPNIIDYIDLIANAEQIHCVPSCIFCLVDSVVSTTAAKLFYHNIRAGTTMRVNNEWNNNRWEFVEYDYKI